MLAVACGALVSAGIVAAARSGSSKRPRHAVCTIRSNTVIGHVELVAVRGGTKFVFRLRGFPREGAHGCHVHAHGDLRDGCDSTCSHYNPTASAHGGRTSKYRHKGDLGNITADSEGNCEEQFIADVRLQDIVGRTLLIHAGADDLGRGGDAGSRSTGNAGKRLACGVIGRLD